MPLSLYRAVEELDLGKELVSAPAGVFLLQLQDQVLDLKRVSDWRVGRVDGYDRSGSRSPSFCTG
jgi:hypothetical protein